MSEREIEGSKDFDGKGSRVEVVDDGERWKKKKKKKKEKKGNDESNMNALFSSAEVKSVALSDKRKRKRDAGGDEPGCADGGHSRDDVKKDMDDGGEVKKRKKHVSNDADNELRSVLSSAGASANSSIETKMKVGREEREGKEKKKRNRYVRDGDQSENKSARGKSEMISTLGESADDVHNDVKQKRKKRKKRKQGRDADCDMKYEVYGNDEFSDIVNESRRKVNTEKNNGENASLKADEDSYSHKKKKKKHKNDDRNSAFEFSNVGIVAVPVEKKAREMEDQSIDNILCEEERSSIKPKKGKVVSFGEAASSRQLAGDCINSSSGKVEDGDSGTCEGNKLASKKKSERRKSDKDKSLDVQKKSMTEDEDAKRNGMDGIATDVMQGKESSGHPKAKSHKRVSFSSEVQVFPPSDDEGEKEKLVMGKRFTKEEDELVKDAVLDYIEVHNLGPDGLDMVLNCKHHSETKGCWKEIGAVIPWRPYSSVYHRAHILFERSETRKWKPEEYDLIKSYYEEHGSSDWKTLATQLGKHRHHLKDTWRRIRLPNKNTGHWSQEEYQKLFDLVHMDLRMKAFEEKKTKHGMLRDNIAWEAISDRMATRTSVHCCKKWYDQLASSMVVEGIWDDADDYLLISALVDVDACSAQEVNWDDLLDHRPGEICRRRWNQMTKHIGEYQGKPFPEQVELLATRYYQVVPDQNMEEQESLHEDSEPCD